MSASAGNSVCAIVVAYHPQPAQLQRLLKLISPQVRQILLVNNGGTSPAMADTNNTEFIDAGDNIGVASALNLGIRHAQAQYASHVLLLDQDSEPAPDMVEQLIAAEQAALMQGVAVAACGPQYVDRNHGKLSPFIRLSWLGVRRIYQPTTPEQHWQETDLLITSGSLISLAALGKIGPMRDGLFIDNIDLEWCYRAQALGRQCLGVFAARMGHAIGDNNIALLGGLHRLAVHPPVRLYYMMRNRVLLYRLPTVPGYWVLNDIPRLIFKLLLFVLLVPRRLENARAMLRGIWHGIRGVEGKSQSDSFKCLFTKSANTSNQHKKR